jgi:hypothetical protein
MLRKLLKIYQLTRMNKLKHSVHVGIQGDVALIKLESPKEILLEPNYHLAWSLPQLSDDGFADDRHLLDVK